MDAAWQGSGAQDDRPAQQQQGPPPGQQAQQEAQAFQREQQQQDGGRSRGRFDVTNEDREVQGRGQVNIEEAMEAVEEGEGHAGESDAGGAASSQQQARRQAVAVDADRSSFERLLLMADMLTDHLPDRYIAALRQL
jgi:hypothetical protein